jgi:hypothetical protein
MTLTRAQALGFERALAAFLDDCAANERCDFHSGGDPGAAYDALMAQIDREPLPAIGESRRAGPGEATLAVVASLYSRERGWSQLADALAEAAAGDGRALLELFDNFVERRPDGSYSNFLEANSAINCVDTPSPREVAAYDALYDDLQGEAPRIGKAAAYLGLTCAFWPVPPANEPAPIEAAGAAPILVIGTTGDPATPYAWSQALASQLDSGVLLTYDGEGHTAVGGGRSDCIDRAAVDYLVRLIVPPAGTVCE